MVDAAALRIVLIRLAVCRFEINQTFKVEADRTINFGFQYDIERLNTSPTQGVVRLTVSAFEDVENPPFQVRVQYEGVFAAQPGHEEGLAEYMRYNAAAALLPYLRETMSSLTARAGYQPLVLPPLNVIALVQQLDAEATTSESTEPSQADVAQA